MKKDPVKAQELGIEERIGGFQEVVLGYTQDEALREAARCLQCKDPTCIAGCPVGIDIKTFIRQITEDNLREAYYTIRQKNNFPSICGRVCPAEYQCRKACVLNKKGRSFATNEAINIHFLERIVGDYGLRNNLEVAIEKDRFLSGFKVAVVGSGPAGLCCAGELSRRGVEVVIFEALHLPGGVLRYGIPPFRLPREILDVEIDYLRKMGVKIEPNFVVGNLKSLPELFSEGFSAVFLGLGAGVPSFLGIKGENMSNIYSANEFLTRVNLMSAYQFPQYHTPVMVGKDMVVIGGGNTAMDAARAALRLQKMNGIPANTTVLYRRSEIEMPARRMEIAHAKEEGVNFRMLVQPKEFIGDEAGCVKKITCLQCRLGEPDSSGRRSPTVIENSDFQLDCDVVIIAVGLQANRVLTKVTPEIKTDKYGDIIISGPDMATSMGAVFAGGDIVGGEGTVIEAMGMAKKAALGICDFLKKAHQA